MPQLTLDIIQNAWNAFLPFTPVLAVFSLLFGYDAVWHIYEWDVMANEKQIEGNFVWWREGS